MSTHPLLRHPRNEAPRATAVEIPRQRSDRPRRTPSRHFDPSHRCGGHQRESDCRRSRRARVLHQGPDRRHHDSRLNRGVRQPGHLSDEQWVLIEPTITASKQDRVRRSATRHPGAYDLREIVNAIFYQNRTGCQWRYLPHDLPTWSAVFYYLTLCRRDELDQRIQELLRCQLQGRSDHPRCTAGHHRRGRPPLPGRPGQGLRPAAKRWVVGQVNGTLRLHQRLARENNLRPDNSASRVYWAATASMTRRLTIPTPAWRDILRATA